MCRREAHDLGPGLDIPTRGGTFDWCRNICLSSLNSRFSSQDRLGRRRRHCDPILMVIEAQDEGVHEEPLRGDRAHCANGRERRIVVQHRIHELRLVLPVPVATLKIGPHSVEIVQWWPCMAQIGQYRRKLAGPGRKMAQLGGKSVPHKAQFSIGPKLAEFGSNLDEIGTIDRHGAGETPTGIGRNWPDSVHFWPNSAKQRLTVGVSAFCAQDGAASRRAAARGCTTINAARPGRARPRRGPDLRVGRHAPPGQQRGPAEPSRKG